MDTPSVTNGRTTSQGRLLTIPNLLSFGRLATVPVFVWLFVSGRENAAVIVYAVAAWTDFFDGFIARRTHSVTELGKLLDPLADRVFIVALALALVARGTLAWGEGSRLRPLTSNMPKPMLPVANRPLMEHILMLLREHGITDVVATVQFLPSMIRNYFGDGSDLDVSLAYATEDMPMGTAGSVLGARDLLDGSFLVVSGDALTDLDVREVIASHREKEAAATIVLKRVPDPLEFGIVMTKEDGRIERFLEKPSWGQVFSDAINTGIYVLESEVLDLMPVDEPYDFSSQLFPMMLDKGLPLYGVTTSAYWTDVGNTDAFMQANQDVLAGKVNVEPDGFELAPNVWVGEDVEIDPSAQLEGPVLVGDNTRIGPGATVKAGAILGDNVIVEDATVVRSVMMDGAHLA